MFGRSLTSAVLLSLNLVSAGPIVKRSVLTDLETVYTDVSTLNSDITGWDGSLLTALPLLDDVSTLETDIKTATTDTEDSSAFDDSDSASVTSEVESLQTLIATTLSDLVGIVRSSIAY
jgi:Hydrophobic surface binding protein A